MDVKSGTVVHTQQGRSKRIVSPLPRGGQGDAFLAKDIKSGQKEVIKLFRQVTPDQRIRLGHLIGLNLHRSCPVLCSPTDLIDANGLLGHCTPLAPGETLEVFLTRPSAGLVESVQLAIALVFAARLLHERGIVYGDFHASNCLVSKAGDVMRVALIDLDNFSAPCVPPPPCIGHPLYVAPELRQAMLAGHDATPDVPSDLFALAVLLHEILLLLHPAAGADSDEQSFIQAMTAGRWLHDPASPGRHKYVVEGYPTKVLNAELARLFRRAFGVDRCSRPTCQEWLIALVKAARDIYLCPHCGGPELIDSSKKCCPFCGNAYPIHNLVLPNGREIRLDGDWVRIGRSQLGGSITVSAEHAIFQRIGPEVWLKPQGRNGSYLWSGHQWEPLAINQSVLVQPSSKLRFADVEVEIR